MTTATNQREVTKDEFYRVIGPLNVSAEIVAPYPYTSIYRYGGGTGAEVGRIVDEIPPGKALTISRYFLCR